VRLTVLGKSPSFTDAGGACSGYLVEAAGTTLLLDCGNGVFGKLRARHDHLAVDAVLISHLHADHLLDLVPYAYALRYSPRGEGSGVRPALHAPPGTQEFLRRVVGAWGDERLVEGAFDLHEYDPHGTLEIGPLRVRFAEVPHFTRTFAVDITADGGRITFGADHGPALEVIGALAADTDLLIEEATLLEPESEPPRGHLTAAEAGEHAAAPGGSCSPTSRTSSRRAPCAPRPSGPSAGRSDWPPRARCSTWAGLESHGLAADGRARLLAR
jgi:ribonuclease BN (tRNA processing enzyme)